MWLFRIFCALLIVLPLLHFLKVLRPFFRKAPRISPAKLPGISIIVPFRNEAGRLSLLLQSLPAFKDCRAEILFTDDHSDDRSADRIALFREQNPELDIRILSLPETQKGKKAAMKYAAARAAYPVLYFCDADTALSLPFALEAAYIIASGRKKLVQGIPLYRYTRNFTEYWSATEFMDLVYIGVYFWRVGLPFLSNAAVMAVDKKVFLEADLNVSRYPGGDDVFLLQHVLREYGRDAISFLPETVYTEGPSSLREYTSQRLRWASKTAALGRAALLPLGVFLLLGQYSWLCFLPVYPLDALALFVLKIIAETLVTGFLAVRSGQPRIALFAPLFSLLLPLFFLLSLLLSSVGSYRWKGRTYNP